MTGQPMSKADRNNLERLARKHAALAKTMIGERVKVLRSEVEDQLSAEHKSDEELWAGITREAKAAVAKADAQIAELCRQVGIPENLRPGISLNWYRRGESGTAERRAELRKLAHARIDAAAQSAKVAVETSLLEVETTLIRGGLETAEAVAFIGGMPTAEQLLPSVDVAELDPDRSRKTGGGWQPPRDAVGHLLAPSTGTDRKRKRQAVAAALAANPDGSDREIARSVGVDHKTVGKLREQGGEIPQRSGELPTVDGEGDE